MLTSRELTIVVPGQSWFEISLWEMGKGRKKEKGEEKRGIASKQPSSTAEIR
jgi:hypothetical protein